MYLPLKVAQKILPLIKRLPFFLELQLFVTLCSWPLLAVWGIPLTPASLLGNLIFTPFVTIFLFVTSLIFISELMGLPNGYLIMLLEQITSVWLWLLSWSNRSWLFIAAHPPFFVTVLLFFAACITMIYRPFTQNNRISLFIIFLLGGGYVIPHYLSKRDLNVRCSHCNKKLTIIRSQQIVCLIDNGIIGRQISAPKQICFTLIPTLCKKGITKLDHVLIQKPSHTVFIALTTLIESFPVERIYIPLWTGFCKNRTWAAWESLLKACLHYNVQLIQVDRPSKLLCGNRLITLLPSQKLSKKNRCLYKELSCTVTPA